MCVRLSPSHPVTRIIAGLYIFLATFLIGFFVSKVACVIYQLTFSDTAALRKEVTPPITPGPEVSKDGPLGIEYLYTEQTPDTVNISFTLTNFGTDTIRFTSEQNTCLFFDGSGPSTYIVSPRYCKLGSEELKPYESLSLVIRESLNPPHYWLWIDYRVGPEEAKHHVDLFVKQPHPPRPY